MARYAVKTSSGREIIVDAPKGTSPEDLRLLAQRQLIAEQMGITPEPYVPASDEGSFLPEVGKGLASGALGLLEAAATGATRLLPEGREQAARQAVADWGQRVQAPFEAAPDYADSWTRKISSGLGSTVPFLAAAPFGLPGVIAGAGLGAAAGSGEAVQRAVESGAAEEDVQRAGALGVIPGVLEMFPPGRIMARAGRAVEAGRRVMLVKAAMNSPAGRITQGALEEGAQEAAAEIMQNMIQQGVYDPERGVFTDTGESATIGAVVGGILAALIPGRAGPDGAAPPEAGAAPAETAPPAPTVQSPVQSPEQAAMARAAQLADEEGGVESLYEQTAPFGPPTPEVDADQQQAAMVQALQQELEQTELEGARILSQLRTQDDVDAANVVFARAQRLRDAIQNMTARQGELLLQTPSQRRRNEEARREALEEDLFPGRDETPSVPYGARGSQLDMLIEEDLATRDAERAQAEQAARTAELPAYQSTAASTPTMGAALRAAQQRREQEEAARRKTAVAEGTAPQQDMFATPEEQQDLQQVAELRDAMPRPEQSVSAQELEAIGIPRRVPIHRRVVGKDLSDPAVREAVRADLQAYGGRYATPDVAEGVQRLLASPLFAAPAAEQAAPTQGTLIGPKGGTRGQGRIPQAPVQETPSEPVADEQAGIDVAGQAQQAAASPDAQENPADATPAGQARAPQAPVEATPAEPAAVAEPDLTPQELADIVELGREMQATPQQTAAVAKEVRARKAKKATPATPAEPTPAEPTPAEPTPAEPEAPADKPAPRKKAAPKAAEPEADAEPAEDTTAPLSEDAVPEEDVQVEVLPEGATSGRRMRRRTDADREATVAEAELAKIDKESPRLDERAALFGRPKSDPVAKYFRPGDTVDTGISKLVQDYVHSPTAEVKKAYEAVKQALAPVSVRAMQKKLQAELEAKKSIAAMSRYDFLDATAVNASLGRIPERAFELFNKGDFQGGMAQLGQLANKELAAVSRALAKMLPTTKIKFVEKLTGPDGTPKAGAYDPDTDTISVVASPIGASIHTVLHEATHAATHRTLQNKANPITKQLQQLLDVAKAAMPSVYGTQSLNDFVAEAFSNPQFKADMSAMTARGERIPLWQKFANSVMNMLRRFVGMSAKDIPSLKTEMDKLLYSLLQQNLTTQDGTLLRDAIARGKVKSLFDSMIDAIPPGSTKDSVRAVRAALADMTGKAAQKVLDILPMQAVVDLTEDVLPVSKEIFTAINKHEGQRVELFGKVQTTAQSLREKVATQKDRDALNYLVTESTINEVDPSLTPTAAQAKYGSDPDKMETYNDLRKRYLQDMSEPARRAYVELRDSYRKFYEDIKASAEARIDALDISESNRKTLKEMFLAKLLKRGQIDPYFPLYRRGDYWLSYTAPAPDGQSMEVYVEAYESAADRELAQAELERTEGVSGVQPFENHKDLFLRSQQVPSSFLYQLANLFPGDSMPNDFMNLILQTMPESSFAQAFHRREGRRGAMQDALSVFNERGVSLATQITNLRMASTYNKLEDRLEKEATAAGNTPHLREYVKRMQGYIRFARNPRVHRLSRIAKMLSFWSTLGANVSSVVVNATNVPVVVLPYLGGKYGTMEAAKAIGAAYKLYGQTGMRRSADLLVPTTDANGNVVTQRTNITAGFSLDNVDYSDPGLSKDMKDLETLTRVMAQYGEIHRSYTAEILDLQNPEVSGWSRANHIMGFMFHHGERANRQVSAIASYTLELGRLRKAKPGVPDKDLQEQAAVFAIEAAERTNSGALITTAGRFAQTDIGTVVMMYKRFGISMLYLQFRMAKEALTGQDAETRRIAKRQIVGLYGTSGILAGVAGVPLYGAVSALYNALLMDDDEEDFDTLMAKWIGEGPMSGALDAITGLDMAARIGMTNLIYRSQPNREQDSAIMYLLETFGGPAVGLVSRIEDGAKLMAQGEVWRGLERAMPSAIANLMKGGRYITDGEATTMRGDPITEDLNPWNMGAQLFGFAPAQYTQQLERSAMNKRIDRKVNEKRTRLLREYYMAYRQGDRDTMQDTLSEMVELGQKFPAVAITGETIRRSIKQHELTSALMKKYGGVTITRNMQAYIDAINAEIED